MAIDVGLYPKDLGHINDKLLMEARCGEWLGIFEDMS